MEPDREYHPYGWTRDDSSSTAEVTFTLALLAQLEPGQVRYFAGHDEKQNADLFKTGTSSDFRAFACSE